MLTLTIFCFFLGRSSWQALTVKLVWFSKYKAKFLRFQSQEIFQSLVTFSLVEQASQFSNSSNPESAGKWPGLIGFKYTRSLGRGAFVLFRFPYYK